MASFPAVPDGYVGLAAAVPSTTLYVPADASNSTKSHRGLLASELVKLTVTTLALADTKTAPSLP